MVKDILSIASYDTGGENINTNQLKTVKGLLTDEMEQILELSKSFFCGFSGISYHPQRMDSFVVVGRSDYRWNTLDVNAKQVQSNLYKRYNRFVDLLEVIIFDQPKRQIETFQKNSKTVFGYIEHTSQVWVSSTSNVFDEVKKNIEEQFALIDMIYDAHPSMKIIIPDTNALLSNPEFEKWTFDDIEKFEILLLPTVLSELDKLKVLHQNQTVRDKALGIIRRIKEYMRRGKLTEGVTIVNNKIMLKALAVEPNFEHTLPWLDINNNDDRILAAFLEGFRQFPNSIVLLVTSDINLQIKAEYANVPFIEPPPVQTL